MKDIGDSLASAIVYCFFRYQDHHHHDPSAKSPKNHKMPKATRATTFFAGIDSVEVDLEMEKARVIGYVDRNKVPKAVRRSGKRAEFWPYPNPPLYFTSSNNFNDMANEYKESYNYWRHAYNISDRHGLSLPATHRGDDKVSNLFNDDNVNACCLV